MKKFAYVIAALAATFAVSCTKETPLETPNTDAPAEVGMKEVTITASVDPETKTSYDADGKFSWTAGDQISILASDNNFYTFTTKESGASVAFSGQLPEGVDLGTYALYPASDVHYFENWQPYFGIDKYKDLTSSFSADLPMTAQKGENDTYSFKHATSALYFTFTNIPDGIKAVEISFENESLQFSGRHKAYYAEPWSLEFSESGNTDDDRMFIRKVAVNNNTANVYLPFKGTLWNGYDNIINIVGYDADGNEVELLKDKLMPGKDQQVKTLGEVIPVAPLVLNNLNNVDWENALTSTVDPASDCLRLKELKVATDKYYMYVRLNASLADTFAGDYLDIFLSDGNGATEVWWGWSTKGTNSYSIGLSEHKGEVDKATGNLTKMRFMLGETRVYLDFVSEVSGEDAYWYIVVPRDYLEPYTYDGKVYVSFLLWNSWTPYGVIPTKGTSMLEVTLP